MASILEMIWYFYDADGICHWMAISIRFRMDGTYGEFRRVSLWRGRRWPCLQKHGEPALVKQEFSTEPV